LYLPKKEKGRKGDPPFPIIIWNGGVPGMKGRSSALVSPRKMFESLSQNGYGDFQYPPTHWRVRACRITAIYPPTHWGQGV